MEIKRMSLQEVLSLPVYSTADIFPMLSNKAEAPNSTQAMTFTLPSFADQLILDFGVKEPIVIWNGLLVDGRNRRAAAGLAVDTLLKLQKKDGLTPEQKRALDELSSLPVREEFFTDEMEADRFIVALNIARRQLSKSQTAAVAALYWKLYEGRQGRPVNDENPGKSSGILGDTRDILSRMFHVNERYIDSAHKLQISDPDNFQQLHDGRKSLSDVKKTPGQTTKPDTDPNDLALQQINDAVNKMTTAMEVLGKATGETYTSAKNNVRAKLSKLDELFGETFSRN